MLMKEEFLKKLRSAFNLNIYEAKIWTALLSKGVATAGEISDISNVPRSRTYDVLETLEKRGFIIMKLGKPIKYLAISPDDIVKKLKRKIETESVTKVDNLEKVRQTDLFNEIYLLHKNGISNVNMEDISASIRGRHNLYSHLESILKDAKKSVIIVTSANGLVRKEEALNQVLKKLGSNKVSIRIATKLTENSADAIKELSKFAEIRELVGMDARFVIVDSKNLVFMVNEEKNNNDDDHAIWISTQFFTSSLETMFNSIWNNLKPISIGD